MEFLNTWQFNTAAYLLATVCFYFSYKVAVQKTSKDAAATILIQVIAGFSILVLVPFFPWTVSSEPFTYVLLFAACLFFALSDRLQTTARKHLEVSIYAVIEQLMTIFLVMYGFTIFQEQPTIEKICGIVLILAGNILIHFKRQSLRFNKYVGLAVIATFAIATAVSIDVSIIEQFNTPFYVSITFLIPALIIALSNRIPPKEILDEYRQTPRLRYYFFTGFSFALLVFFSLRALQLGEVSTVAPLQAISVLLNVFIAYIFLSERDQTYKKVIAAIIIIAGVFLTSM